MITNYWKCDVSQVHFRIYNKIKVTHNIKEV
jgi:hypothetical protein